MKIVDGLTGKLQQIPFVLGQDNFEAIKGYGGRIREEVRVSSRPGQVPSGPEAVDFFSYTTGSSTHVTLIADVNVRRGMLLRVDTEGVYRKFSEGKIKLLGGSAELLTAGRWAWGRNGSCGGGPDELWHVSGSALFYVRIAGHGGGDRYIAVTSRFKSHCLRPEEAVRLIAADDDPEVSEVFRQFCQDREILEALSAATLLDALPPHSPVPVAPIEHYRGCHISWQQLAELRGLQLDPRLDLSSGGVAPAIMSGLIVPGDRSLVGLQYGAAGGRRYSCTVMPMQGLIPLAAAGGVLLATVDPAADRWAFGFRQDRDGSPFRYELATVEGLHTLPAGGGADDIESVNWEGLHVIPVGLAAFHRMFPELAAPPAPAPAPAPASAFGSLADAFTRARRA